MKFYELLAKEKDENIIKQIVKLYPDEKKNKKGYERALRELRKIKPKKDTFSIIIENTRDGKEKYEHVSGYQNGERYAIEFNSWENWLGMYVDMQSMYRLGELSFLAHAIWEMTWSGYSNKSIQKRWEALRKRADEAMKKITKKFKVPKQVLGKTK